MIELVQPASSPPITNAITLYRPVGTSSVRLPVSSKAIAVTSPVSWFHSWTPLALTGATRACRRGRCAFTVTWCSRPPAANPSPVRYDVTAAARRSVRRSTSLAWVLARSSRHGRRSRTLPARSSASPGVTATAARTPPGEVAPTLRSSVTGQLRVVAVGNLAGRPAAVRHPVQDRSPKNRLAVSGRTFGSSAVGMSIRPSPCCTGVAPLLGTAVGRERRLQLLTGPVGVPLRQDRGGTRDVRSRHRRTAHGRVVLVEDVAAARYRLPARRRSPRPERSPRASSHRHRAAGRGWRRRRACRRDPPRQPSARTRRHRENRRFPRFPELPAAMTKRASLESDRRSTASLIGSVPSDGRPPRLMLITLAPCWTAHSIPAIASESRPVPLSSSTLPISSWAPGATPLRLPADAVPRPATIEAVWVP